MWFLIKGNFYLLNFQDDTHKKMQIHKNWEEFRA